MGVNAGCVRLLLAEHAKHPFNGSILQLGRQTISVSASQVLRFAQQMGVKLDSGSNQPEQVVDTDTRPDKWIDDLSFFSLLGFKEVLSCDVSSYEHSDLLCDLNVPVPKHLHSRFDVVLNGGTLEHIFNVPAALANIHEMLKIGGRIIHVAPSSNLVDHGFYSFSPTLFADYYQANRYEVLKNHLFECYDWTTPWSVYEYSPGCLDDRWNQIASSKMTGVFFIAQKQAVSTSDASFSQSYYRRLWSRGVAPDVSRAHGARLRRRIKEKYPHLTDILSCARSCIRRFPLFHRGAMPPLVGKF